MKVDGKVALITGGARGLGEAFARSLLENGAKVCLLDVLLSTGLETASALNQQFGSGSCEFIKCDVTSQEQMERAFAHAKTVFGAIDLVVNNAGIFNEDKWEQTVAINLNGVIRGTLLAMRYMQVANGGRGGLIVNVASVAGLELIAIAPVYSASKFGCVGLTRNLGLQAIRDPSLKGIRVSCLCPSFTDTELFRKEASPYNKKDDPLYKMYQKAVDIIGIMKIEDVAKAFMALVEDDRAHGGILVVTPKGAVYEHPRQLKGSKL